MFCNGVFCLGIFDQFIFTGIVNDNDYKLDKMCTHKLPVETGMLNWDCMFVLKAFTT